MDSGEPKEVPKVQHEATRLGSMNDMAYCGHSKDKHTLYTCIVYGERAIGRYGKYLIR